MSLLQNQGRSAIRNASNGPYGDALWKVIDPHQLHVYMDTIDYTPEMEELLGQFSSLVSEYHLSMSRPVICEFDGQVYSSEDELPEEHQEEISRSLWLAREEQIAPIYSEMINDLNEFSRLLGYENYLDYCFAVEYNRDYTPEDVRNMISSIYELCAPLLISSTNCIGDASLQKPFETGNDI